MNREKLREILVTILENLPTLATVGAAVYMLVRSQTGGLPIDDAVVWILALLGLLATSELVERFRRLQRIDSATQKILTIVHDARTDSLLKGSTPVSPLSESAPNAKTLDFLGYSLIRLVQEHTVYLDERLREGLSLRVLIIDRESKAAASISEEDRFRSDVDLTLKYLARRHRVVQATGRGSVEVHVLDWIPSCSLVIVDAARPNGWMRVGIYPPYYHTPFVKRVYFNLTKGSQWFAAFQEQFEELWKHSVPFDLSTTKLTE